MSDNIDRRHHVFRYIGGGSIDGDFIDPAAFRRRKRGSELESGLSVNWVEWFSKPTPEEAVQPLREVLIGKGFSIGTTSRFALLGVGDAIQKAAKFAVISIVRDAQPDDESHSLITRYDEALNDQIAEQLQKAIIASYQAKPK